MSVSALRRSGHLVTALGLVVGLAVAACGKNASRLDDAAALPVPEPGSAAGGGPAAAPQGGAWAGTMAPTGWTISGTVQLAPELQGKVAATDVLFVMARAPGQRMPVAVERIEAPQFPVAYTLSTGHGTEGAGSTPAELEVLARVSKSGMAGPPQAGDLEGIYGGRAVPGATGVDFVVRIRH